MLIMTKKLLFNVFFQSMLRIRLCRNLPSSKLYEKLVFRHDNLSTESAFTVTTYINMHLYIPMVYNIYNIIYIIHIIIYTV